MESGAVLDLIDLIDLIDTRAFLRFGVGGVSWLFHLGFYIIDFFFFDPA